MSQASAVPRLKFVFVPENEHPPERDMSVRASFRGSDRPSPEFSKPGRGWKLTNADVFGRLKGKNSLLTAFIPTGGRGMVTSSDGADLQSLRCRTVYLGQSCGAAVGSNPQNLLPWFRILLRRTLAKKTDFRSRSTLNCCRRGAAKTHQLIQFPARRGEPPRGKTKSTHHQPEVEVRTGGSD